MNPHDFNLMKANYTISETKTQLCVGHTKLYDLIKKKQLTPLKIGKKTIFPAAELARFLSTLKPAA